MDLSLSQAQLESLCRRVASDLSRDELLFFLNWVDDEIIYINFDRNENSLIESSKLKKLKDFGLVDECPTCQEDVWYTISPIGMAVQAFISKNLGSESKILE